MAPKHSFDMEFSKLLSTNVQAARDLLKTTPDRCMGSLVIAAQYGHDDIVKTLRSKGCEWGADTSLGYAINGDVNKLKWAYEDGCTLHPECTMFAAQEGHLDMLKWLAERNCPINDRVFDAAEFANHAHVTQWLSEEYSP